MHWELQLSPFLYELAFFRVRHPVYIGPRSTMVRTRSLGGCEYQPEIRYFFLRHDRNRSWLQLIHNVCSFCLLLPYTNAGSLW